MPKTSLEGSHCPDLETEQRSTPHIDRRGVKNEENSQNQAQSGVRAE